MNSKILIKKAVRIMLPVPLLDEMLAESIDRNKKVVLSIVVFILFLPVLALTSVFAGGYAVNSSASQDKIVEQQKQAYLNSFCQDNLDQCEVKPEFREEEVECADTPDKCRKRRQEVDCAKTPGRCEPKEGEGEELDCGSEPGKCAPKPGENELYYKEQEQEELDNVFKGGSSDTNVAGTLTDDALAIAKHQAP